MYWEQFLRCRDAKTNGGLNNKWVFGIAVTNTITTYVSGTEHIFVIGTDLLKSLPSSLRGSSSVWFWPSLRFVSARCTSHLKATHIGRAIVDVPVTYNALLYAKPGSQINFFLLRRPWISTKLMLQNNTLVV